MKAKLRNKTDFLWFEKQGLDVIIFRQKNHHQQYEYYN